MEKNVFKLPLVLYVLVFVVSIVIFIVFSIPGSADSNQTNFENKFGSFWYADEKLTQKVDVENPTKNVGYVFSKTQNYYTSLPKNLAIGDCFSLQFKNATAKVYIQRDNNFELAGNVEIKNAYLEKSPGTVKVDIPLSQSDAGSLIKVEFNACYNDTSCHISNVIVANQGDITITSINEKTFGTILSIILAFVGLALIVIGLILKISIHGYKNSVIYIGFFAIAIALWSLCETRVLQVLGVNQEAVHVLANSMLILGPLPIILYFADEIDDYFGKILMIIGGSVNILNIVVCFALNYLKILDFHQTLISTHIIFVLSILCAVFANVSDRIKNKNPEKQKFNNITDFGLLIFVLTAVIDMIRYKTTSTTDIAMFMRIGVLAYVITLAIHSIAYAIDMLEKGIKSEFVSRLAYEDGLTGLGNRTAYQEKVFELSKDTDDMTVFMFDVNDLKLINDNLGHDVGDQTIVQVVDAIENVFGKMGSCYRVGGDEFVCIIERKVNISMITQRFLDEIDDINATKIFKHRISVSVGASYCKYGVDLKKAVAEADEKMYENKRIYHLKRV